MYTFYKCKKCNGEFVLVDTPSYIGTGIKITCPLCRSPRIKVGNEADNLKECMEERKYYRAKGGAWRQK